MAYIVKNASKNQYLIKIIKYKDVKNVRLLIKYCLIVMNVVEYIAVIVRNSIYLRGIVIT